jgi:hypothetical protein
VDQFLLPFFSASLRLRGEKSCQENKKRDDINEESHEEERKECQIRQNGFFFAASFAPSRVRAGLRPGKWAPKIL